MMNKKFFWKLTGITLLFSLIFHSCRQESILSQQDEQSKQNEFVINLLNKQDIENKKSLFNKINELKENKFKRSNLFAKNSSIQDSILEGAIIETDKIVEITNGDKVTYTFPVSRTFPNNKVENLVLKKNLDSTYSGVLIQYSLTPQEMQQVSVGQSVNLTSKVKIFRIEQINIAARIQTDTVGCLEITWETGYCASGQHNASNADQCQLASGVPDPSIISIVDTCEPAVPTTDISDGYSPPGGGSSSGGGAGSGSSNTNPYNTYIFMSFDDMYLLCDSNDAQCFQNVADIEMTHNFLSSLGLPGMTLEGYTPIFNLVKSYLISGSQLDLAGKVTLVGNWMRRQDNSTDQKSLSNYKVAHWALQILMEDDTLDYQNFFNRVDALELALEQNPNLLLEMDCDQLQFWQDVAMHQIPQSVINKLENIPNQNGYWSEWNITDLDDGAGARVNMDLFPVKITSLPNKPGTNQKYTPAEFFDFFRKNINLFAEKFIPIEDNNYNIHDTVLWNSSNPLGALIHIEIFPDNGTVVCSGFSTNTWIFSTVKAPLSWSYDGIHPVAGNRAFSFYTDPNDDSITIYTRGVDRLANYWDDDTPIINFLMESAAFKGADNLWHGMQQKLRTHVKDNGGSANIVPSVKNRPNYNKIKKYLKNQAPLSSSGCN